MEDQVQEFLRTYKVRRVGRVTEYVGLSVAGIMLTFNPATIVSAHVSTPGTIFWSVSMAITGTMAAWGSITDRWLGEYAGLPLLAASMWVYGGAVILDVNHHFNWILLAFGIIVFSFGSNLIARWRDVQAIKGYAERHPDERYRGGALGQ
jgi:hypothetical protein